MYDDFFYKRLTALRIKKDVAARAMSLDLGLSENYINKIENGKTLPSMKVFFYICEYLNITPMEFFDNGNETPELLSQLNTELRRLDEKSLKNVLELVKNMK